MNVSRDNVLYLYKYIFIHICIDAHAQKGREKNRPGNHFPLKYAKSKDEKTVEHFQSRDHDNWSLE